jgi:hypothetical protein
LRLRGEAMRFEKPYKGGLERDSSVEQVRGSSFGRLLRRYRGRCGLSQEAPDLLVLAGVAASRGDVRSGALLVGFVDAWNRKRGYEFETTERKTHALVMEALRSGASALPALLHAGATATEDEAILAALAIS